MADNITLPGTGAVVETREQADGSERQVFALGSNEAAALIAALKQIANPTWRDPTIGALRVQCQTGANVIGTINISANQNLATVAAVTSLNQFGGHSANGVVFDLMRAAWGNTVRRGIS